MPGLNQKGPRNEGAMTGRRGGVCTGSAGAGPGYAQGRGAGGGRCRRGSSRGQGRGMGYGGQPGLVSGEYAAPVEDLKARADMLEAELLAVKQQLKGLAQSQD